MHSVSRRILSAALTVGSLNGVVMIVSIVRDLAFAYRFGTGEVADAFLMGLLIPSLAVQLIAGSLSIALIPEMMRTWGEGEPEGAAGLSSSVAALALGLLCLVATALIAGRESVLGVLTAGFDRQRTELTSFFYLGTLPCIVIQGWSLLVGGMLNAKRRFAVVALAPILRPLAVCTTLAVDWGADYALVLLAAYLIGAVAEAVDRMIWSGGRDDVAAVMSSCDVVCSSSVYGEGFSNTLAEAMACGRRCVATDVGDARRILGQAGYIVPPGDDEALASSIERALDDVHRAGDHSSEARDRIEQNFSLPLMVSAFENEFSKLSV